MVKDRDLSFIGVGENFVRKEEYEPVYFVPYLFVGAVLQEMKQRSDLKDKALVYSYKHSCYLVIK